MSELDRLFGLDGVTALVTGGGSGVGAMIATGLSGAGAKVYVAGRHLDRLEQTQAAATGPGQVLPLVADLSSAAGRSALVADLRDEEPALDVLVNNAGTTWSAPLAEFPQEGWDTVVNLNVTALFHLTQGLLPMLRRRATADAPARVINLGSAFGTSVSGSPNYSYSASKAAVHMLTRQLALELAPEVLVNAIAPGPFESDMMRPILARAGDEVKARSPLGRIGRPSDMAAAAVFLASPGASFITGCVLPVDGGISTTR